MTETGAPPPQDPQDPQQPPYGAPPQPPYGQQPQPPYGQQPQPPYGQQPQPPYGQPHPPYGYGPQPVPQSDEKLFAILGHLGGVFLSFLVPLVIWLVYRERSRFLDHHGKEALNFQITLLIAYVVGVITSFIGIGLLIILAAWVLSIVFAILASVSASRYEAYRYPINIRFIS